MLYKDIPKFTSVGNYEVNFSLLSFPKAIEDYQKSGLQLNPDFQRGNVWNIDQQRGYIEFLLRGGETAKTFYFNQPGWMSDWSGDFVCVDGLQRITALLKFLDDKLTIFNDIFLHDIEDRKIMLRRLNVKINVNNLKTRKELLQWYIDFNSGGTIHSEKEIERVKKMLKEIEEEE